MATQTCDTTWVETFTRLAAIGSTIEVAGSLNQTPESEAGAFRTRLLAFTDDEFIIEQPASAGAYRFFKAGMTLWVIVCDGVNRWQCRTTVIGRAKHALNAKVSVTAVSLTRPHEAIRAQRRVFFRVPVVGLDIKPACFSPVGDDDIVESPVTSSLPAEAFQATIVDIGAGGICAAAPRSLQRQLRSQHLYTCRFSLPTREDPFEIRTAFIRVEQSKDRMLELGFKFDPLDDVERNAYENDICYFVTWQQRRHLQNRRND